MNQGIVGRLGKRSRAGLMGCAVLFGALLLVPQDVLAQKEKTTAKSSGSSGGSSAKSSSGGSRSSGASSRSSGSRSSGSRSSSARSSSSSSKSSASSRSSARSSAASRSKSISKPAAPKPSIVSRPSASRSTASSSTRPSGGAPSIRLPEKPGDGPPRHLIDIVGSKGSNNKPGQGPKDGDYAHRPRHHSYPYYYPYYFPHRYYGIGYGYFGNFYSHGYPYYFYGPYGYFYAPHLAVGYGGVGYGVGYGGGGGGAAYGDGLGALDLNVKPKDAIVYVDGDAIGPVDRYDGYPSYLWLEPGTYNLSFYLEGYQTLTLQHTVLSEVVISVKERLQPGVATPPPPAELADAPPELPDGGAAPDVPQATVGRLLLQIRPPDAAVYLDGHFLGTAGELAQLSAGLVVEPGQHVLELVRPGYQTEEVPLTVPADGQIEIDLELRPR